MVTRLIQVLPGIYSPLSLSSRRESRLPSPGYAEIRVSLDPHAKFRKEAIDYRWARSLPSYPTRESLELGFPLPTVICGSVCGWKRWECSRYGGPAKANDCLTRLCGRTLFKTNSYEQKKKKLGYPWKSVTTMEVGYDFKCGFASVSRPLCPRAT